MFLPCSSSQNLANYHLKEAAILAGSAVGPLIGVCSAQLPLSGSFSCAFTRSLHVGAFVDHSSLFMPYCVCGLLCVLYVPAYFMKVSAAEPKGI